MAERQSKFNVDKSTMKRTWDGIVFDSEMEMRYYRDVLLPLYSDDIVTSFELQKEYELQPAYEYHGKKERRITYVADFYIEYSSGHSVVIDIKGHADPVAKLKRKMFQFRYPDINYRWITWSKVDGGWVEWDYVQSQRRARRKVRLKQKELESLEGDD